MIVFMSHQNTATRRGRVPHSGLIRTMARLSRVSRGATREISFEGVDQIADSDTQLISNKVISPLSSPSLVQQNGLSCVTALDIREIRTRQERQQQET